MHGEPYAALSEAQEIASVLHLGPHNLRQEDSRDYVVLRGPAGCSLRQVFVWSHFQYSLESFLSETSPYPHFQTSILPIIVEQRASC